MPNNNFMEIVFASNNENKIIEVGKIIPAHIKLLSLKEIGCYTDIPENENTLEGNSLQKANYIYQKFRKNCIADDTGLEISALNGAPGVHSARYAGEPSNSQKNIEKALSELENISDRSAQFRTIFTLIIEGNIFQFEGFIKGKIIDQLRGKRGFGYDPIFVPDGYSKTFAELSLEIKNNISHRGIATRKLIAFLRNYI